MTWRIEYGVDSLEGVVDYFNANTYEEALDYAEQQTIELYEYWCGEGVMRTEDVIAEEEFGVSLANATRAEEDEINDFYINEMYDRIYYLATLDDVKEECNEKHS